ncbi:MAG: hypothetical protein GYB49_15170 [Alphaproteobacteria bacterium]|nr:hypothetical protein [Alphaproteobacteria bacterium]
MLREGMLRRLIAILLTVYAIAFAFGALTAVRWPSIMMVMSWIVKDDIASGLESVDWRQLGIAHGGPYLIASLCFYSSGVMVAARRRGGVLWYLYGLLAGIPCLYLVTFEPGWWRDPSPEEGAIAGVCVGAILLFFAVWELRVRPRREVQPAQATDVPLILTKPLAPQVQAHSPAPDVPAVVRKPKPTFVPAAIARQRASFAVHGRKMQARRRRAS